MCVCVYVKACVFISLPHFLFLSVTLLAPPSVSVSPLTTACVSDHFVSVCLFCYRVSFVLLLDKLTFNVSHLPSPCLPGLSLSSFVMRTMVDDCALGDLLLDPASVRCGDERKAMKGGWETGRSRWKIEQYTGR